jgi:hypothetical protein
MGEYKTVAGSGDNGGNSADVQGFVAFIAGTVEMYFRRF